MSRYSFLLLSFFCACGAVEAPAPSEVVNDVPPPITANNAFFYYDDVDRAAAFYEEVLGLDVVADYGFAKIFRIAGTSYLTVVSGESGMHSTDEPKAVAIALVTDQLEAWYEYLTEREVPMRGELEVTDGHAHDGFVAYDPEGYYLEFERFNPHEENVELMPVLDELETHFGHEGLGFKATVLWTYYADLARAERFYEDVLGLELMVDQGWAKIYPTSTSGFIGLVDGERGMHQATTDKAVTVSFITEDVDGWFAHLEPREDVELRHDRVLDEGFVRVFVGYDPENYFLEFDTFVEHEDNGELLRVLSER